MSNGSINQSLLIASHTSTQSPRSKSELTTNSHDELIAEFTHAMDTGLQVSTASEHINNMLIKEV